MHELRRRPLLALLATPLLTPRSSAAQLLTRPPSHRPASIDLEQSMREAAARDEPLRLPGGIHRLDGKPITLRGLTRVRLELDADSAILDEGRPITTLDGRRQRIPWGIRFEQCGAIQITGGRFETAGDGLRGRSGGLSAGDIADRRPVLDFVRCGQVAMHGVTLSGNPGPGILPSDLPPGAMAALSQTAVAALGVSHAFVRFVDCDDVLVEDGRLAPDRCAREMWVAIGCRRVAFRRLSSHSDRANFASLAKIIRCEDAECRDFSVRDQSEGSLVDIIARRFHISGFRLDYPKGKLLDISHEWQRGNGPIEEGLVEDCETNGTGIVNVRGRSAPTDIDPFPIGQVTVRRLRVGPGAPDEDIRWINLRRFRHLQVEDCDVLDNAAGRSVEVHPGAEGRMSLLRCRFAWRGPVPLPRRAFAVGGGMVLRSSSFRADSTAYAIACVGPSGSDRTMTLESCDLTGLVIEVRAPLILRGCVLRDCVFRFGGQGRPLRLEDCQMDYTTPPRATVFDAARGSVITLRNVEVKVAASAGSLRLVGQRPDFATTSGFRLLLEGRPVDPAAFLAGAAIP